MDKGNIKKHVELFAEMIGLNESLWADAREPLRRAVAEGEIENDGWVMAVLNAAPGDIREVAIEILSADLMELMGDERCTQTEIL
jgi:hypothetical protein